MRATRILVPTLSLTIAAAGLFLGGPAPAKDRPPTARLGSKVRNVTFQDAAGKQYTLQDFKGRQATVVVFLSFDCPASTGYAATLAKLARAYRDRGVVLLGIVPGDDETAAEAARKARDLGLPFAVHADPGGAAIDAFQATATPEVFVLDRDLILRYRGRIDDRYAARLKQKAQVNRQDLRVALDEILAGKAVTVPATLAVGCPIVQPAPQAEGRVTFYRDVLPILQARCQSCHRPGEVGPFSLMTYRQALRWAQDIKEYTQSRKMPPWKVTGGAAFHNDRRMPTKEIAVLAAWVDGGRAEGEPSDAPPPRSFAHGWQLGQPDLVLTVPNDFHLRAEGQDLYRCFVLPTNLPEDRYVAAVEVRPGNRRVAHHALLFTDRRHQGRKLVEKARQREKENQAVDHGAGYSVPLSLAFLPGFLPTGNLGGWAPGLTPRPLPQGAGYLLPKGADVVMQMHYHRSGRAETDRTCVGLYFSRDPGARRLQGLTVPATFLVIPAGARNYRVDGRVWVRQDCKIYAVMPHMHLLGRKIKVTMTPPGGKTQTLVAIDDWDFNWQEDYHLMEPIAVRSGTRFDVEGFYDNSEENPFNPFHPPRPILAGMQTVNEMCVGFLGVTTEERSNIQFDLGVRVPGLGWLPGGGIPGLGF